MTVARQTLFLSTMSHFHVNVDSNEHGGLRGGGGEDSRKRKRSQTRAQKSTPLNLRKKEKKMIASFLKGLVVDIDCSVRKESFFESSWKSKLWKRELVVFHAAQAENRKGTELVFRVKAKFSETWPKRNRVKKRARFVVLAARSGSTLLHQEYIRTFLCTLAYTKAMWKRKVQNRTYPKRHLSGWMDRIDRFYSHFGLWSWNGNATELLFIPSKVKIDLSIYIYKGWSTIIGHFWKSEQW